MNHVIYNLSSVDFSIILPKKDLYFKITSADNIDVEINGESVFKVKLKCSGSYISLKIPGKDGEKVNIKINNTNDRIVLVDYDIYYKNWFGMLKRYKWKS